MSTKARTGLAVVALAAFVMSPLAPNASAAPGIVPSAGNPSWVHFSATDRTKVPDYFGTPNWLNSPQTLSDAVISFTRGTGDTTGTGAKAIATVNPKTGGIASIDVIDSGSGYTATPNVVVTSPGVTPSAVATATAGVSQGVLTAVNVQEKGYGYTTPNAVVSGGSPTTPAVVQASGGVDVVILGGGGTNYVNQPWVEFSPPDLPDGVPPTAVAEKNVSGAVTGVDVVTSGSGYTHAPTVTITDAGATNPTAATAVATLEVTQVDVVPDGGTPAVTGGAGYASAPTVTITDTSPGTGTGATATSEIAAKGAVTTVTVGAAGAGYLTPGLKKFVDTLPGQTTETANNLEQYIPVAVPDKVTYPGTDYYEIAVVQYRHRFSSSLPDAGTLVRGYVQLSTARVPGRQLPLANANLDPGVASTPVVGGYTAVDTPSYLGPTIVAEKNVPVRILFRNLLPTGSGGDLFLPTDTSIMGAGAGPNAMMLDPATHVPMDMTADQAKVTDAVRNPYCAQTPKPHDCYTENRATLHMHGGITPWISDGTPHQWTTPAGESTDYPKGVSVSNVPDMPSPGPGAETFFYTNQQSARLMFYHDHSWGITRLNVYAGEAAAYLLTDATEQKLTATGGALEGLGAGTPLVVQDKTFVPSPSVVAANDPTWNTAAWGGEGSLWLPHVYMPAQNPGDASGMSRYGRWMYGPWFWPPATGVKYPPIDNPYYDPACDPEVQPFCEPKQIPSTPNVSTGMEAFNDTPVVNGTAYPKTTVDPKTYRYRILNGSNDRFWDLQWYVADPTTGTMSEVALDKTQVAAANEDPNVVPNPDTTLSPVGPSWVQIGTEGGFLPTPAVIPSQPLTWITDPTRFDVGNVDQHSLLLGPAERADVLVDFSQYRGKTLILYNDAPAAFPARQANQDYYTGHPDMTASGGAPTTLPGYGPNTRTVMQVKVSTAAPAVAFDRPNTTSDRMGALEAAFAHHADPTTGAPAGVFESGSNPIIVGQSAYNTAYGTTFGSSGYCNTKDAPLNAQPAKCDGFARIQQQGGDPFTFDTLAGPRLSLPLQGKGIHDEMNAASFDEWGRMSANIGLEAPGATPLLQNIILYPFSNPATELLDGTAEPSSLDVTPISTSTDGTQIWKITHNGVDTHPIHFHLFDVQVLDRVTWDNIIMPPDANELGWKDTVRISPLEDTYVALRPIVPTVPFGVPDSVRPLNPMMPVGATGDLNGNFNGQEAGFNNTDTGGNPMTDPIVNAETNFGWEYVWHCHMLSHEEMDMMRPMTLAVARSLPTAPVLTYTKTGSLLDLRWTDGTPVSYLDPNTWIPNKAKAEIGYRVQRAPVAPNGSPGTWADVSSTLTTPVPVANATSSTVDTQGVIQYYRVVAWNAAGDSASNAILTASLPGAPTGLVGAVGNARVGLTWTAPASDGGATVTGYAIQRSTNSGTTWTTMTSNSGSALTSGTATGLTNGTSYVFRVAAVNAVGTGPWSTATAAVTPNVLPLAPTIGAAVAGVTQVTVGWTAPTGNGGTAVTGYVVQQSSNSGSTWTTAVANTGSTAVSQTVTGLTNGTGYVFRVAAINAMGTGPFSAASASATPQPASTVPSAPAIPTAVAGATGSRSITVTWVAPANGGSAITGYAIQRTSNNGTTYTTVTANTGSTAVTRTVTLLTAGTSYRFRVAAINANGTGAYSGLSTAINAR